MIVYIESNFVLELALQQEEHVWCEEIWDLAKAGKISLAIPAYCFAEPYEKEHRNRAERNRLQQEFVRIVNQLARSKVHASDARSLMQSVGVLLANSIAHDRLAIDTTLEDLLSIARIIDLTDGVCRSAFAARTKYQLGPQDAIVYASILSDAKTKPKDDKCFVSRDSKAFADPDLQSELTAVNCKFLARFKAAANFLKSLK